MWLDVSVDLYQSTRFPLKGSLKRDMDLGIGIDVDTDVADSTSWGSGQASFKRAFKLFLGGDEVGIELV